MKSKNRYHIEPPSNIQDIMSLKNKRNKDINKLSNTDHLNLRKFEQVKFDKIVSFKCPTCYGIFGMETEKIEGNEANIHYFCPYCGLNKGIDWKNKYFN